MNFITIQYKAHEYNQLSFIYSLQRSQKLSTWAVRSVAFWKNLNWNIMISGRQLEMR